MTKINGHARSPWIARRWPIIIISMLGAHMAFMAIAVTLATRSKYTVIPNYYQRAVDWDKNRTPASGGGSAQAQSKPTDGSGQTQSAPASTPKEK